MRLSCVRTDNITTIAARTRGAHKKAYGAKRSAPNCTHARSYARTHVWYNLTISSTYPFILSIYTKGASEKREKVDDEREGGGREENEV